MWERINFEFRPKSQKSPKIAQIAQNTPKIAEKGCFSINFGFRFFIFLWYYNLWANHWWRNFSKKVRNKNLNLEVKKKFFPKSKGGTIGKLANFPLVPPLDFVVWNFLFSFFGRPEGLRRRNYREAKPRRTSPPQAPSEARYAYIYIYIPKFASVSEWVSQSGVANCPFCERTFEKKFSKLFFQKLRQMDF